MSGGASDDDDASSYVTEASSHAAASAGRSRKKKRRKKRSWAPAAAAAARSQSGELSTNGNGATKKQLLNIFNLSRTNQILQGHSPTTVDSLSPAKTSSGGKASDAAKAFLDGGKRRRKKTSAAAMPLATPAAKKWMNMITSELFSARVTVVPKPAEFNANVVPQDPRRGRYKTPKDYGLPNAHLCKLIRKHLLANIMTKLSLVRPRVNTNLGKKKPSKKELEEWKIRRGRRANEKGRKKKRGGGVVSTKRRRVSARYRACPTCGDFHFRRACGAGSRDLRINLMVKQIYQKAEVIKENMDEAWDKLDSLESAYHDMLMRVHRLQSNRVCIGLLTGEDYPGEDHPEVCPCADVKEKEELDRQRREEREREEERRKAEERERLRMEKERRERILEMRKKRFYSRMRHPDGIGESIVRFQDELLAMDDGGEDDDGDRDSSDEAAGETDELSGPTTSSGGSGDSPSKKAEEEDERRRALLFKTGLNDLARLDASRRRRTAELDDALDPIRSGRRAPSLLTKLMEKVDGRKMDLVVMDGSIKKMGYTFLEDGTMFRQEETVRSFELEEEEEPEEEPEEDATDVGLDMEEEELAFTLTEESVKEEPEEEEGDEKEKVPFGDFLDLMEVF